jgi:hypothetical protein
MATPTAMPTPGKTKPPKPVRSPAASKRAARAIRGRCYTPMPWFGPPQASLHQRRRAVG